MNNDLLKYISEYFNAFPKEDYTICVNGTPTKWCSLNTNTHRIVWNIPSNSTERDWHFIDDYEIKEVSMTATTMVIKKTNGKEYTFTARIKEKEEKVKDLLLKADFIMISI